MTAATSRIIQRALSAAGPWTTVGTVTPAATTYQDTGLTNGTEYFYRVISVNAQGNSPPSNVASATPSSASLPPGSPLVWLDATDESTMWQDSGQTTPVTTTGDPIGYWADKSGNNNDFTQSDNARRPTWQGDHVRFQSDWLIGPDLSANSEGTLVARARVPNPAGGGMFHFSSMNNFQSAAHYAFSGITGTNYSNFCINVRPSTFPWQAMAPPNTTTDVEHTYTNTYKANLIARVNGVEMYNVAQVAGDMGTAPIIGGTRRNSVISSWVVPDGELKQLLVYDSELTGTDLTDAEAWVESP